MPSLGSVPSVFDMDTSTHSPSPAETVGAIYQAFGTGDVARLLDLFDDDVTMELSLIHI